MFHKGVNFFIYIKIGKILTKIQVFNIQLGCKIEMARCNWISQRKKTYMNVYGHILKSLWQCEYLSANFSYYLALMYLSFQLL
jgi:hypothetical protein